MRAATAGVCLIAAAFVRPSTAVSGAPAAPPAGPVLFQPSQQCVACHDGLTAASGQDISIGSDWRGSMMANSSRDPYWQASVRREMLDHPQVAAAIEDECATCHMPMSRAHARAAGQTGRVFAHLAAASRATTDDRLARDGVSCALCHQIAPDRFGTAESFSGGFVVPRQRPHEARSLFGPYEVDRGRATVMRSASAFVPAASTHVQQSELCATCHTLFTDARGPEGQRVGRLAEQVPYLEWASSAFRTEQSCQACHMPVVAGEAPIASVLGQPRGQVSRHVFAGGNFFLLGMLNRFRDELRVEASPQELALSMDRTSRRLESETATLTVAGFVGSDSRLEASVEVRNLAGHKFPTGYPSRRAWLHVRIVDARGRVVFESGKLHLNGSIDGNDNDDDPLHFEPHHDEIQRADQAQIYESIMADISGAVTTGLLSAVRFVKDNRLLPRGFDTSAATSGVAVIGEAAGDTSFSGGGDRIRYVVAVQPADGPFTIDVELLYQPVAYRWAQNLRRYPATEPQRFVRYYESMAATSSHLVARAGAVTPR